LQRRGEQISIMPSSRFSVNEAGMARRLAILGAGIAALGGDQSELEHSGSLRRVCPNGIWGRSPSMS
jgi:hypothetical protein